MPWEEGGKNRTRAVFRIFPRKWGETAALRWKKGREGDALPANRGEVRMPAGGQGPCPQKGGPGGLRGRGGKTKETRRKEGDAVGERERKRGKRRKGKGKKEKNPQDLHRHGEGPVDRLSAA